MERAARHAAVALSAALPFTLAIAACGAPAKPPPETAAQKAFDDDKAPDVAPRELAPLPDGECGTQTLIAQIGASCKRVDATAAEASGGIGANKNATDADACTVWSSGGMPPQYIGLDLGAAKEITGLLVIPDSTPPMMEATHRVEVSGDNQRFHEIVDVKGSMTSGHGYAIAFPQKTRARFVRVTTVGAPSFVAWREITAIDCP
jgi:hypothetical protein